MRSTSLADTAPTSSPPYPVDPAERVSPILAYPGVRAMYEREGFIEVAPAAPVPGGPSRVAMVLDLR
ncbi:hypothetical protein ACFOJ6_20965 [Gordonia humi]|uniref:hypothetical protein n=1 Tax=Gordonia humi TaxID=686429 RepID=UPI003609D886